MKTFICLMLMICPALAQDLVKAEITKVTDGDTVKAIVNNEELNIRLLDIDTFETRANPRAYWQAEENHLSLGDVFKKGEQSKQELQKIISKNKGNIYIDPSKKDKYGRTLGTLYIGNNKEQSINQYMLDIGGALPYKERKK